MICRFVGLARPGENLGLKPEFDNNHYGVFTGVATSLPINHLASTHNEMGGRNKAPTTISCAGALSRK
jgi:hypothetical protein